MDNQTASTRPTRGRRTAIWVSLLALLVTIGLCFLVVYYWEAVTDLSSYGYAGIVFINILAGATMVVPVPALFFVFTFGSLPGFSPLLVGACAGFGEALGAIVIYLTGYGGRAYLASKQGRRVMNMVDWVKRRGTIAVFAMSAFFNPFFYPVTIPIGAMRWQLWKFFLATWAGKTIKGLFVAYLGYYGLGSLLRALGIAI